MEYTEDRKKFLKDIAAVIQRHVPEQTELPELPMPSTEPRVYFRHRGTSGAAMPIAWGAESAGTKMLLDMLPPALDALEGGHLFVVDEIDTSLHPLLAQRLIGLFQSAKTNPRGAQLIFTTHDTNLLRPGVLRRDQIWFTEKDECGATSLFPLSDIKTRKDENIQKGYLEGRYGGIPYVGDTHLP